MKFAEALQVARAKAPPDARPFHVALVCGYTANHLEAFLTGHLRTLPPEREATVRAGLCGAWLWGECELRGGTRLYALAGRAARHPGVRLVNPQRLDQWSPPADRRDVRGELLSGFPYRPPHASAVAQLLACLLLPPAPKK